MDKTNAARPIARLIRRATLRLARRLAFDVVAFGVLLAALRLAANRAAFDAPWLTSCLFALFLIANVAAFLYVHRKKPGLYVAAERLERRDPGLLTAALDLELHPGAIAPSQGVARAIARRSAALIAAAERFAPDELEATLVDAAPARLARFERILRGVACLALLAAFAIPDRRIVSFPTPSEHEPAPLVAQDEEKNEGGEGGNADASDDALEIAQEDAFDALRASIDKANESAVALLKNPNYANPATLRRAAAFCRLARDPEFGPLPLARRALREAAPKDAVRPGLRNAYDILEIAAALFLSGEYRDQVDAFERALLSAPENESDVARNALAEIRATLDRASRLLAFVATSREFDAAIARYESSAALAFERARDALANRAGKFPGEDSDDGAVEAFHVALDSVDAALTSLRATYDDAFEQSRLVESDLPNFSPSNVAFDPTPSFNRLASSLDAAASCAKAERWGVVATYLASARRLEDAFAAPPATPPASPARLAFAVTFGELAIRDPALALSPVAPAFSPAPRLAPARDGKGDAEGDDLDGEIVASSEAPETDASRRVDAEIEADAEREARGDAPARLADRGTPADARGGAGAARKGASPMREGEGTFAAELPDMLQEELDRARKWRPGETELRRVDAYRDALRRIAAEKDGEGENR